MVKYYKFSLPVSCFNSSLLTLLPGSSLVGAKGETIFYIPCGERHELASLSIMIKEKTNYQPVYLGLHEGRIHIRGSGAF